MFSLIVVSKTSPSNSGVTSVITILVITMIMTISLLNNYPHDGKLHLSVHLILYDNGPGISVMIPSIHFWREAMKPCAQTVSLCALLISCTSWYNRSNFDLNCQLISRSHNGCMGGL